MSRTVRDLINHAYASVGVGVVGQDVDAGTFRFGLDTFNEMLDLWRSEEIPHGLADLTADDIIYNGAFSSACRKNLAILLAESFGMQPPLLLARAALSEKARLVAFDGVQQYDSALSQQFWR